MNAYFRMAVDKPTTTDFTSEPLEHLGGEGWFEVFLPFTGAATGTLSFRGGMSGTVSTHDDLELDDTEIYVEGANLDGTPVTGLAYTAPGTLTLDGNLAADVRIRIPIVNPTPWLSVHFNNTGAGDAASLIQVTWFCREDDY